MKIKFGYSRKSCDVDAGMPRIPRRVLDRQNIVCRDRIPVQDDVVSHSRNVKSPVHFRFIVARYRIESRIDSTKETAEQVASCQWVTAFTTDFDSASESEFQE